MVRRMLTMVGVVALIAGAVAIVAAVGFHRAILQEIDTLIADGHATDSKPIREADLDRVPAPVRQWLRYSRVVGTMRPTTVRLRQQGDFNLGRGWMPFTAEQYFTTSP